MYLIDYYVPVLARISEVFGDRQALAQYNYEQLRHELVRLIDSAASGCGEALDQSLCRDASFATVAFVDEKVLSSDWPGRHEWAAHLLQKEYFNTTNAGVQFFDRLDRLNAFNPRERDVKEVFLYCLCLGFAGQYYRSSDQGKLRSIIDSCGDELSGDAAETALFPEAYPSEAPADYQLPRRGTNWTPLYAGVPLVLLLGLYVYFRNDIVSLAQQFLLMI